MPIFHNKPVATLIKRYVDKRSGHVQEAREELQRRFDHLDWSQQKKIVAAILSSSKTDRKWMYTHMLSWWDDCFAPQIKDNWEQYHEERCAWLIIRYFPKEYVMAELENFTGERDYFHVCSRFCRDEDFVIDDSKLSVRDRFVIHGLSKKPMDGDRCLDDIFTCLHETCVVSPPFLDVNKKDRGEVLDALDIKYIYGMRKNMERMGLEDHVRRLTDWNRKVNQCILNSSDWQQLNAENLSDDDYNSKRILIMLKYVYKNLDDKYKSDYLDDITYIDAEGRPTQATREQIRGMIDKNPAIGTLIESFGGIMDDDDAIPF